MMTLERWFRLAYRQRRGLTCGRRRGGRAGMVPHMLRFAKQNVWGERGRSAE